MDCFGVLIKEPRFGGKDLIAEIIVETEFEWANLVGSVAFCSQSR